MGKSAIMLVDAFVVVHAVLVPTANGTGLAIQASDLSTAQISQRPGLPGLMAASSRTCGHQTMPAPKFKTWCLSNRQRY
jgi:hypothetical protein